MGEPMRMVSSTCMYVSEGSDKNGPIYYFVMYGQELIGMATFSGIFNGKIICLTENQNWYTNTEFENGREKAHISRVVLRSYGQ